MRQECRSRQAGFSLVELMVAMVVTVIITGAIFGLMTVGSNAFQREPEMTDRQQSIRVAMDAISRDVMLAGQGLPTFAQIFTINDPSGPCAAGLNDCGPAGSMGGDAATNRGETGQANSDVLEMLGAEETCPPVWVCSGDGATSGATLVTREVLPACLANSLPGLGLTSNNDFFAFQPFIQPAPGAAAGQCPTANVPFQNGTVQSVAGSVGAGVGVWNNAGNPIPSNNPLFLYPARIARYTIAPGPDAINPAPSLWRTTSGRFAVAPNGTVTTTPDPAPGTPWQVVAQGIEDMQIEYFDGVTWTNSPPVNIASPPNALADAGARLVQGVRITLSARITAGGGYTNLQGATQAAGTGADAIRGQLVSVVAPRRNIAALQLNGLLP